jgi:DNA polymerase elongation subunit (family B)
VFNCQYNRYMNFYTCVEIRGNKILYRGVEDGSRVCREIPYRPTLYSYTHKSSDWKTLDGRAVEPIKPGTITETRDFLDQYANISGFSIFGQTDFIYQFIGEEFPNDIDYKIDQIVTAFIDIETKCEAGFPNIETANEQVIAITVRIKNKSYVYGLGTFHIDNPNVSCNQYDNENQMLKDFIEFWEQQKPDIVTGWNVRFFDIPYLYNRISYLFGEDTANRLSPWKKVIKKKIETKSSRGEQTACDIIGVSTLDYYELYKKFTYTNQESYRLDYIASVELGEKKLSYDEYDSLREFYKQDFNKFIHYNFHDVELVFKLDQKMKLIELVLAVAYSAKVNHEDVYSQVRTWDTIIYHELLKDKIVIPPKKSAVKERQYEGAYVKEPILGMNDWIISLDLNSLYPHLIQQYNLSPETKTDRSFLFVRNGLKPMDILEKNSKAVQYLEMAKKHDISVAANGVGFTRNSQGFLPRLMEKMYAERKHYKELMLESEKEMVAIEEELKRRGII